MQDIRIWMENRITNLENMINGTLTPDIMGFTLAASFEGTCWRTSAS